MTPPPPPPAPVAGGGGRSILEAWLPREDPVVEWAERHLPALSRGLLGTLFLLVSTLTIERWDSFFPESINDL